MTSKKSPSASFFINNKLVITGAIVSIIGLLLGVGISTFTLSDSENRLIDRDTYQAVQLTDGSVFYGQIQEITDSNLVLKDVYYENSSSSKDGKVALSRHGTEPYQPSGIIQVNRNQILFWENLSHDSLVTKTIKDNTD